MTVWIKQGVMGVLNREAQKAYGRIAKLYHELGQDFYCTSKREGNHMYGSLHYIGDAFDFRRNNVSKSAIIEAVDDKDFDIVFYDDGRVHVEYDPK